MDGCSWCKLLVGISSSFSRSYEVVNSKFQENIEKLFSVLHVYDTVVIKYHNIFKTQ